MKKSFALMTGALALSTVLTLRPAVSADAAYDEKFEQGFLQDELTLLAHADHNHAAGKHHEHHAPKNKKSRGWFRRQRDRQPAINMAKSWREYEHKNDLRQAEMGKYADLYLQPARPAYAQYTKQDQLFSSDAAFSWATKAHSDAGTTIDVAQAAISSNPVRLRDALFASELVKQGVASHLRDFVPQPDGSYSPSSAVNSSIAATQFTANLITAANAVALPVNADAGARNALTINGDAAAFAGGVVAALNAIVAADAATQARMNAAAQAAYIAARTPLVGGAVARNVTAQAKARAAQAAALIANNNAGVFAQNAYLGYLGNDHIKFNSEYRRWDIGLNVNRYFFDHRFALGVYVPVVEDRHILSLEIDDNVERVTKAEGQIDSLAAAMYRYDGDQEMLQDFFAAKGMHTFGGTSAGIGDVQLYGQARLDTKYLDRAVFGMRVVCPTATAPSTSNLWAPQRGNGGFFQAGLSLSAISRYKNYFNPHFFIEGLYSLPGSTNLRVPKKVSVSNGMDQAALGGVTPLGYRLDNAVRDFTGFDAAFRGLGDTVSRAKVAKGLAFDVRIGNVFEQVFVRRANLDVFYNIKLKASDRVYGLAESDYNLAVYEQGSQQMEHRLGGQWRWQVNHAASVQLGVEQVLWGKNVAQETKVTAGFNYGF